jgi:predicted nucleic acid-binding protein
MIAVDTNILVYAHRAESEWFEQARSSVKGLAENSQAWGIPWPCIHEFLAIVTHTRIFKPPTPLLEAVNQVEIWLEAPSLHLLGEMKGHRKALKESLLAGRITGGTIHDARIALSDASMAFRNCGRPTGTSAVSAELPCAIP